MEVQHISAAFWGPIPEQARKILEENLEMSENHKAREVPNLVEPYESLLLWSESSTVFPIAAHLASEYRSTNHK